MRYDSTCQPERPHNLSRLVRAGVIKRIIEMPGREPTEAELGKLDAALRDWEMPDQ